MQKSREYIETRTVSPRTSGWFHGGLCGVAVSVLAAHTATATQPPGSDSTVTHTLKVSRFSEIDDFTERNAREIIAKMAHILQTDDDGAGPNDVECDVDFMLAGPVETFADGTGTISTEQDFRQIIELPGDVKVVESVDWCGTVNSIFAGCSDGLTFVVEAGLDPALAGPLWAHEFGHVRELGHRQDEPTMVMNSAVGVRSRQVDDRECRQYR